MVVRYRPASGGPRAPPALASGPPARVVRLRRTYRPAYASPSRLSEARRSGLRPRERLRLRVSYIYAPRYLFSFFFFFLCRVAARCARYRSALRASLCRSAGALLSIENSRLIVLCGDDSVMPFVQSFTANVAVEVIVINH